ncbi:hypothetical protein U9M48_038302 [Paspalum notatum var. saurae]|uniref:Uncharacterized protein n=1 Tax=Paspalum notatum var. saurae TaxID=547442 RepID=A0AAQ3UGT6_PASNO
MLCSPPHFSFLRTNTRHGGEGGRGRRVVGGRSVAASLAERGSLGEGIKATGEGGGREMAPASGWGRALGNTRSFVGNALGGLRGWSNLASWTVAGTLAYYLWVKPARQLQKEQEERAALAAASDPYRYIEKRKPIPDPQDTGLIYGKKKETTKSED